MTIGDRKPSYRRPARLSSMSTSESLVATIQFRIQVIYRGLNLLEALRNL